MAGIFVVRGPLLQDPDVRIGWTTPDEPAYPVSYASTLAQANVTWPPFIPCIQDPGKGPKLRRPVRSAGQAISLWRYLSKRGDFAADTCCILNYVAKFPLFSGELRCRSSEARVSRLTGKFDTTASERTWQVAFSVLRWQAGRTEGACRWKNWPINAKAPLPCGVAPRHLHRSLASRTSAVDFVHLLQLPGRVSLVSGRSVGGGSCRALRSLAAGSFSWQPVTSLAPSR